MCKDSSLFFILLVVGLTAFGGSMSWRMRRILEKPDALSQNGSTGKSPKLRKTDRIIWILPRFQDGKVKRMKNSFGKAVVKSRFVILVVAVVLLFPSVLGYLGTRTNYDMLTYLPKNIETMKGQDILTDDFGTGAVSMVVVENMPDKDVEKLADKMEDVKHVNKVLWYGSLGDLSMPKEMLPEKIRKDFMRDDATLVMVTFDTSTSADETMDAVKEIRRVTKNQCYVSGMSAVVTDTKDLAQKEEPMYVLLAVVLASIVLALTMDTFLAPVFFLLSIGMAIIYNMGTNIFLGQISYVTKALAAILQLGVTMDYSIFLWHSYQEKQETYPDDKKAAMAEAINATLQSVVGSSVTTIAGFAALCFMSFSLGLDIGIVMMKGVALGVVSCVTILPSMILTFDKWIEKTHHKPIIPKFAKLPGFVQKHYKGLLVVFCIVWIPAIFGYFRTNQYYDLTQSLPKNLPSVVANQKLEDDFQMNNTLMLLVDKDTGSKQIGKMCDEMEDVKGIKNVLGIDSLLGGGIPREALPDDLLDTLETDKYELIVMSSEYKTASDEINAQINTLNKILKKYDPKGMLIGEAPATKDLITISNHDFNVVNWASIAIIAVIIAFVFKSLSLPFLLVLVIEFAIFINMSIPYYMGTTLPFIASIVIGTVQLGSTVDYAILMTSRYQTERYSGKSKKESILIAHRTSIQSIIVSAFTFFASTFGVGIYSNISMISSLCMLMARGALISMVTVITILPAVLMAFDPLIIRTSIGFINRGTKEKKGHGKHAKDDAENHVSAQENA